MDASESTMELGRLCSPNATTTGPRHQLLYVRDHAIVVMPYAKAREGWECVIVGSRGPRHAHHLTLTDSQITAASPTILAQPERDPDGYARLVWMSQAFRRWPGGAALALARHLVEDLRPAASLHIWAPALADHNAIAARLPTTRPAAVGRLLDQIIVAGLLSNATNHRWSLTLPRARRLPLR